MFRIKFHIILKVSNNFFLLAPIKFFLMDHGIYNILEPKVKGSVNRQTIFFLVLFTTLSQNSSSCILFIDSSRLILHLFYLFLFLFLIRKLGFGFRSEILFGFVNVLRKIGKIRERFYCLFFLISWRLSLSNTKQRRFGLTGWKVFFCLISWILIEHEWFKYTNKLMIIFEDDIYNSHSLNPVVFNVKKKLEPNYKKSDKRKINE